MRTTQQSQQQRKSAIIIKSSSSPWRLRQHVSSSSSTTTTTTTTTLFLSLNALLAVCCCLSLLPLASSQSSSSSSSPNYLLSETILKYMDVVSQLYEHTTKQDLNSQLGDIASGIGFSTLSFLWEAPNDADVTDFAQVILGRKDNTCYAVFHGLSISENYQFVADPKPIPNLRRPNCNSGDNNNCACRAHWSWVDVNFPTYWQEVHTQLDTCMESCAKRNNNEQCDLVLGGHGAGGSVAALLSFHFAASNPYVITAGSPDVMYDSDCQGINEDRYFRFINTDTPGKDISGGGTLSGVFHERLYLYGICFDEIPFTTRGSSSLRGLGTTIAMGLEKGGMAIATGGTGQLNTLEDEATRTSLCRSAHDMLSYKQKMQSAVWRNPLGVTPVGFSNFQYCEVDQDCRSVSTCEPSDDYPICTDNSVVVAPPQPQPTPPPTTRSPTTPRPSPKPSPFPTTARPSARPTLRPTTAQPSPKPSPFPTPRPSLRPTPEPTPTAEPTRSVTDSPTWPPTVSPTSQPTKPPTPAPITPGPTQAEAIMTGSPTVAITTTPSPTVFPSVSPSSRPTVVVTIPEEATGSPTSSEPALPPPSSLEAINGSNGVPTMTTTMGPSAEDTDFFSRPRQPTETPSLSSTTSSPTTILTTKPPAEYDSNDNNNNDEEGGMMAPTQKPVVTPPPTLSTSALPLFDAFFRTTLVLQNVKEELTGFTMFWWEDETSDHLRQWIDQHTKENNWEPPIVQLRVQTNIVSQSILFVSAAPATDVQRDQTDGATISSILEVHEEEENESKPAEEMKKDKNSARSGKKRSKAGRRVRHRHQRRRGRRLQTTTTTSTSTASVAESLQIVFEIAIAYRTLNVRDLDLHGLILEAFQNDEGRKQYGKRLQKSNDPVFENLSDFILQIEETPNSVETSLEEDDDNAGGQDKTIIWALIGAAGAAVVLSLGMFLWYLTRVSNKRQQKLEDYNSNRSNGFVEQAIFEPASGSNERLSPDGTKSPRLSQEIVVDENENDGISTLGDPTFYPGAPPMLQDEQTASVNFAQNYLKMHDRYDDNNRTFRSDQYSSNRSMMKDTVISGSALTLTKVGSGLSHLNESAIFDDDDESFEQAYAGQNECFKVLAPPGKLGIIIDLSRNGEPMVRAIRGDSTLADQVQIGDFLLSVDGETVAEMSAEQVSKLIAVKSNQAEREILFVRRPADYR